ncbi:ankyrin repeat domain-containing protein 13B isoform X2 [Phyllostomus discolor]|uniref:Ankyrin repeat domain-containing protein 13B isoform X2 n=3 Tax=Phyllostomus discolor TaxID=89673 RepID=A0A6J2MFS4_9CHIR|nr:ankyrin repeat domain-containing protein 13B isoform X2 [Phyllostomus discolor]
MSLTFLRSPPSVTLLGMWMSSLVPLGPKFNPEGHTFPLPPMLKRGPYPFLPQQKAKRYWVGLCPSPPGVRTLPPSLSGSIPSPTLSRDEGASAGHPPAPRHPHLHEVDYKPHNAAGPSYNRLCLGHSGPLLSFLHPRIPRRQLGLRAGVCGCGKPGAAGARPCGGGGVSGAPRPVRPRARCGRLLLQSSGVFVCGGVGGEARHRVPASSPVGWGPLRVARRRRLTRTPAARAARLAPGAPPPPAGAARTCPSCSLGSRQRRLPAPRPLARAPAPSLLPGRAPRPRHEEQAMIPANASARKGPEGKYPLHYLVWHNRHRELEKEVRAGQVDIEQLDPRGRTPLHLATTLGHLECARVLLAHGADVGRENRSGWTVLQEAVSTRDLELVQLVLRYRDYQRVVKRLAGIPVLLEKLRKAQDFYVEMKWEFTSWVPLVSKICPSDTYKVWKSGQNLRVDTTLLGFDHMTWQRGNRSFVFRGQDTSAVVMEIDHDRRVVYTETLALAGQDRELLLAAAQPTEEQVLSRLTAPVVTTQLDTKNISFERNKTGILGWRSEKTEMVNGYEAKVYGASNVELITRTRTEHLSEQHKGKVKGCKTPLQSFLGIAEQHGGPQNGTLITQTLSQANPTAITAEEYFNPNFELGNRDMGRPMELTTKTQKFKAKLWLCEEHPLSLCEQVAPIIDLMAVSNALFAKLRDFITLRLPPGFPVKIEIPIFHILNARITFGNLNGCDEPVPSVRGSPSSETPSPGSDSSSVSSSSSTTSCRGCEISPALFEAPRGYSVLGGQRETATRDDDDDLLQFAIQQSLLEAGSEYDQVTIWEALTNSKPGTHPMSYEGRRQDSAPPTPQRQPATPTAVPSPRPSPSPGSCVFRSYDEQLRLAMELSAQEQEERRRRARQEEEELERILRLSLTEQ